MMSWPAGLFLAIAGLWLLRVALRATDERLGRLTSNWPTPWPTMSEAARKRYRFAGAAIGLALLVIGLVVLL